MTDPIRLRYKNLGAAAGSQRCSYEVRYEDGRVLLERCKDPLTDGARAVLKAKKKWPKDQQIELIDGRGVVLVRADLTWASTHTVSDTSLNGPRFAAYVPFDKKGFS